MSPGAPASLQPPKALLECAFAVLDFVDGKKPFLYENYQHVIFKIDSINFVRGYISLPVSRLKSTVEKNSTLKARMCVYVYRHHLVMI